MDGLPDRAWRVVWALAVCAFAGAGCANLRLPRIDPSGERIFLPAESLTTASSNAPVAPMAPAALPQPVQEGVSVQPAEVVAPVGGEVLLVAGVYAPGGIPCAEQRVQWTLSPEGIGRFNTNAQGLVPGTQGLPASGPEMAHGGAAFGVTSAAAFRITRGASATGGDLFVKPGQTWIGVTSGTEGTSYVTAAAPGVFSQPPRTGTARIHWIDAQWVLPPAASATAGGRISLVTSLTRRSDGSPIPGWQVRYEILGGTAAGFGAAGGSVAEASSNASGQAIAEAFQSNQALGTTHVGIQILRPPLAGQLEARPIVVATGSTSVTWSSAPAGPTPTVPGDAVTTVQPQIEVQIRGPTAASVGSEVQFEAVVTNRGIAPVKSLVVTDTFDVGLEHGASGGTQAIERTLGDLDAGTSRRIPIHFRVTKPGALCHTVVVTGEGELRATARACLQVAQPPPAAQPAMEVTKRGPQLRQVGQEADFIIEVRNSGNVPLTNVRIVDTYEQSLKPTSASRGWTIGKSELIWVVNRLEPGQSYSVAVRCVCAQATDRACNRVDVESDQRPHVGAEACIQIVANERR
jgi:uncharacterized repeat protein (TIGR01451 family)